MRKRESGVVLLVSLLLVMSMALLGRIAVGLNPGLLALSANNQDELASQRAADSGLEYALNRLREDPNWRAETAATTVSTPQLTIVEGSGNVIGLLSNGEGEQSQFRIRFNFQDGPAGADNLDDPTPQLWVDHPYVSINNSDNVLPALVPRGEGTNYSVADPTVAAYSVPGNAVVVLVEGRAGPALQTLTSAQPNASISGKMRVAVSEANFRLGLDQAVKDAALMAGSDVNLVIPAASLVSLSADTDGDIVPRIRSKGSISVLEVGGSPGQLTVYREKGEIGFDSATTPGFLGTVTGQGADLVQESVGDGSDFYNLKWDDVTKADPDPASTETVNIPAGTYVVWDDGSLHYYEMGFSDYQSYMSDPANHGDGGQSLTHDFREVRSAQNVANRGVTNWYSSDGKFVLGFSKDVHVRPATSGVTDFSITTRGGTAFSPTESPDTIPGAADSYSNNDVVVVLDGSVLSGPGDVRLLTKLKARAGTITSEGEFVAIAPSTAMLEHAETGEAGLNLYARGDISLSSYRDSNNNFGDMHFRGLLYSWGDLRAISGHESLATDRWNKSSFHGAVVAYGDDPVSGSPGASGRGTINMVSEQIALKNHTDKLSAVLDLESGSAPVSMQQTLYASYR